MSIFFLNSFSVVGIKHLQVELRLYSLLLMAKAWSWAPILREPQKNWHLLWPRRLIKERKHITELTELHDLPQPTYYSVASFCFCRQMLQNEVHSRNRNERKNCWWICLEGFSHLTVKITLFSVFVIGTILGFPFRGCWFGLCSHWCR